MCASQPILIFADDSNASEALHLILTGEGYETLIAHDSEGAMKLLDNGVRPCLILLDVKRPEVDGEPFLQRLRHNPALATLPVMLCTTSRCTCWPGVQEVLTKVFDLDQLLATIRRHVR